jgi:Tol biopolymer transport system component/DNA-binding winged helix-turn-helix (wHTH) protein
MPIVSNPKSRPDAAAARSDREPVQVGDWLLRPDLAVLRRGDEEIRLGAKAIHVLLVLIDAGEAGVARDTLLDKVWGESYPSDAVVSRAIADLRSAFGEKAGEQAYIRTLPKFGYQLVASCGPPTTKHTSPKSNVRRRPLVVGAAIAVAMLIAVVWSQQQPAAPDEGSTLIRLPLPRPLTSAPGLEHQPRIAPNGDWVVYAALRPEQSDWDLFRVAVADGVSQVVAASPGVHEHGPAISPDGDEVAYVRLYDAQCEVVTQSITLGVPKKIAACTTKFPTTVDWSPDGKSIAYTGLESADASGLRRLYIVNRFDGEQRLLSSAVSPTGSDYYPRFSPSGSKVAFLRGEPQPDHRASLWLVDVETGAETRLTAQPSQLGGMAWLDEATLVYAYSDGGQFENRRRDLSTGIETRFEQSDLVHPDYHAESNLLVAASRRSERDLVLLHDKGVTSSVASSTSDDHHGALSGNGSLVAFISRRSGYDELWIFDTRTSATRRLTRFDGATVRYPDWHPDDQRILFTVQTEAGERLFEVDVVSGSLSQIGDATQEATTPRWFSDGERWAYECLDEKGWGICIGAAGGKRRIADAYFRPTPLDDETIAVVDSAGVLYRMNIATGSTDEIFGGLPSNGRYGWTIDAESLVYVTAGSAGNSGRILQRNLATGEEVELFEGSMPLADTSIRIAADSGGVLFTRFRAASDDLVIFEQAIGGD